MDKRERKVRITTSIGLIVGMLLVSMLMSCRSKHTTYNAYSSDSLNLSDKHYKHLQTVEQDTTSQEHRDSTAILSVGSEVMEVERYDTSGKLIERIRKYKEKFQREEHKHSIRIDSRSERKSEMEHRDSIGVRASTHRVTHTDVKPVSGALPILVFGLGALCSLLVVYCVRYYRSKLIR